MMAFCWQLATSGAIALWDIHMEHISGGLAFVESVAGIWVQNHLLKILRGTVGKDRSPP